MAYNSGALGRMFARKYNIIVHCATVQSQDSPVHKICILNIQIKTTIMTFIQLTGIRDSTWFYRRFL